MRHNLINNQQIRERTEKIFQNTVHRDEELLKYENENTKIENKKHGDNTKAP